MRIEDLGPATMESLENMVIHASETKVIRRFLSGKLPGFRLSALGIYNICVKVMKLRAKSLTASLHVTERLNAHVDAMDVPTMELFLRGCVAEGLQTNRWPLQLLLCRMQRYDRGFQFRVGLDENNRPAAVLWMTSHQLGLSEQFGQAMFLDAKHGGCNRVLWPWFGPTLIDSSNSPRMFASCFSCKQSGPCVAIDASDHEGVVSQACRHPACCLHRCRRLH